MLDTIEKEVFDHLDHCHMSYMVCYNSFNDDRGCTVSNLACTLLKYWWNNLFEIWTINCIPLWSFCTMFHERLQKKSDCSATFMNGYLKHQKYASCTVVLRMQKFTNIYGSRIQWLDDDLLHQHDLPFWSELCITNLPYMYIYCACQITLML